MSFRIKITNQESKKIYSQDPHEHSHDFETSTSDNGPNTNKTGNSSTCNTYAANWKTVSLSHSNSPWKEHIQTCTT